MSLVLLFTTSNVLIFISSFSYVRPVPLSAPASPKHKFKCYNCSADASGAWLSRLDAGQQQQQHACAHMPYGEPGSTHVQLIKAVRVIEMVVDCFPPDAAAAGATS